MSTRQLLRLTLGLCGLLLGACRGPDATQAPRGSISDVVVVLKGSAEPLPFDPRGGRLTVVTREIARLVGHPIVLELDAALSPELVASLEETVLASFETLVRELVLLQKEDPDVFARAQRVERIVCTYDAVATRSEGELRSHGSVVAVRSPPDRFPLLQRGVFTAAIEEATLAELDARWGEEDPRRLSAREQEAYFAYMTTTRPGAGYAWVAARARKSPGEGKWTALRAEHVERILRLASAVARGSALEAKVRRFLVEQAGYVGGLPAGSAAGASYGAWLGQSVSSLDDDERGSVARAVFESHGGPCRGPECAPGAVFPSFDRFAFGLSIYDGWTKDGARVELPPGPRGELYKRVVCPSTRRGEAETELRFGCSAFFARALQVEADRTRLADVIARRRDLRLLEIALSNLGSDAGASALALVESVGQRDEALFRHGAGVLFHDLARRDDVRSALETAAPRWWRDAPSRRGFALLVMARRWESLDVHYSDNQWTRFVAEFGGPIQRDVFASYLAEGPRAVELAPRIWPALARTAERDELVARSLHVLLARDHEQRTSRAPAALTLLRTRLCGEKSAAGLAAVRASIERWVKDHPADAAAVSNARGDFTLARCTQPPKGDATRE